MNSNEDNPKTTNDSGAETILGKYATKELDPLNALFRSILWR
jgi:hypothetical protein